MVMTHRSAPSGGCRDNSGGGSSTLSDSGVPGAAGHRVGHSAGPATTCGEMHACTRVSALALPHQWAVQRTGVGFHSRCGADASGACSGKVLSGQRQKGMLGRWLPRAGRREPRAQSTNASAGSPVGIGSDQSATCTPGLCYPGHAVGDDTGCGAKLGVKALEVKALEGPRTQIQKPLAHASTFSAMHVSGQPWAWPRGGWITCPSR